mmetsp:Transcript_38763/g.78163  ORF Transcript_38763/g.78163 Transcript_38763/m.78163 type:complete len:319 (+) Transcript_38763:62-1018(+)
MDNSKAKEELKSPQATSTQSGGGSNIRARVIGSACAGVSELLVFHPVDTVAKRLMMSHEQLIIAGDSSASFANLNATVFQKSSHEGVFAKWQSLFPGLGYGAGYKIMQRVYKFGGQPYVKEGIDTRFGDSFRGLFGKDTGKTMMSATAGSIMGVGEIALLPLDVLKIKAQTNPESLAGRGLFQIVREEGMGLYRGAGWTALRNAPGSFSLFGGSSLAKQMMGLKEDSDATFLQESLASVCGATASITVAAPLDVIKTRIQSGRSGDKGGVRLIGELMREEGPGGFFRGLWPKLLVVGPKLVFSFTIAQQLISALEKKI